MHHFFVSDLKVYFGTFGLQLWRNIMAFRHSFLVLRHSLPHPPTIHHPTHQSPTTSTHQTSTPSSEQHTTYHLSVSYFYWLWILYSAICNTVLYVIQCCCLHLSCCDVCQTLMYASMSVRLWCTSACLSDYDVCQPVCHAVLECARGCRCTEITPRINPPHPPREVTHACQGSAQPSQGAYHTRPRDTRLITTCKPRGCISLPLGRTFNTWIRPPSWRPSLLRSS